MPTVLLVAFRTGRERLRDMLVLGALYAVAFLGMMGLSALLDGGQFAQVYLGGAPMTREIGRRTRTSRAPCGCRWLLYLPLSLLFWHAPGLVHWHGVPPVKALFFSIVACVRNFKAFTLFGLAWVGVFLLGGLIITVFAALIGSPQVVGVAMVPGALLMAAMFFTSVFFTFRDSFAVEDEPLSTGDTP
jgi:hypothetical protein